MSEEGSKRLQNDLGVVMEKVQLCREIMLVSPGIKEDEMLAEVIGFLEACRDRWALLVAKFSAITNRTRIVLVANRMSELIESGTQGLLSEELFEKALMVNDAVTRTLEAEKVRNRTYYTLTVSEWHFLIH